MLSAIWAVNRLLMGYNGNLHFENSCCYYRHPKFPITLEAAWVWAGLNCLVGQTLPSWGFGSSLSPLPSGTTYRHWIFYWYTVRDRTSLLLPMYITQINKHWYKKNKWKINSPARDLNWILITSYYSYIGYINTIQLWWHTVGQYWTI